jgi:hypothetical protein
LEGPKLGESPRIYCYSLTSTLSWSEPHEELLSDVLRRLFCDNEDHILGLHPSGFVLLVDLAGSGSCGVQSGSGPGSVKELVKFERR